MAGESSSSLFEITSEWFLDYCIHLLWKEFRQKRSFSDCWRDTVQDYLVNKKFGISHELANKVHCIRFLIGLVENYQGDNVSSSQESSSEEQLTEDENDVRLLGCDCLKFFDKILQNLMFPFSNAERSHMRSALKLQIVLSHYRHGNITEAKNLFSKLYNENGPDEEYQDDIRELFQSENDSLKDTFLRTHTYDRFLMQVQQFFTPVWKKFETPVLAESTFLENLREESGLKIDAKTLKALFFAWDQSEEAEQNWSAVVEGTHLNIKELKNKKDKRNLKDTDNHSTDKITRQVIKSRGAATYSQQTSLSVNIQRCDEVLKKLKASSRRLFSGLKDDYSDMIAGKAGPSGVVNDKNASGSDDHDHDTGDTDNGNNHFDVKRQCKSVLLISSESPNDKKVDTRGKRPLERKAVKRRFNEEHSDAEIVEWESDDETDLQPKMIKLPSPHRKRCLNVKLPTVKHRKFWTAEETKLLEDGVKVYGEGNWTRILNAYNFVGRTSVNLKDRWRTLRKNK